MTPHADQRLAAAPLTPEPVRAASLAAVRRDGSTLVASGQVAVRDGALLATGRVGADVDLSTAQACAWQCTRNVLEAVREELGTLDEVEQITKLTVYVASASDFTEQHLVAHAASSLVLDVLGPDRGAHARVAIGVAALPLGSPVEVEAILRARR
ncbi:RidA family protein [Micromonospora sp. DR5-3]|uniref:RidA family protein n=1 Tax=unclassified Micromonospora TaxID=2617518 RepID=UPI0011DA666E|nr:MULTISPECIES: RidA family protein [unclassified Micromonospora]MCW3818912.1 RidA family protein [Micromonospora sp. DR5-3]TYC20936.1 RidA family protein [Micromonospora sp. MP36]